MTIYTVTINNVEYRTNNIYKLVNALKKEIEFESCKVIF